MSPAGWQGARYPNTSSANGHDPGTLLNCGVAPGCLFDVRRDPGEHDDLAQAMPDVAARLGARLDELKQDFWQNAEEGADASADATEDVAEDVAEEVTGEDAEHTPPAAQSSLANVP